MERSYKLQVVQDMIGYAFARDVGLLWEALSFAGSLAIDAAGNPEGNKRLAVVGDGALTMTMSTKCFNEGESAKNMNNARERVTNNLVLGGIFDAKGLEAFVNLNPSQQGIIPFAPKPTTVEAIIGAVFIDSGANLGTDYSVITKYLNHNAVAAALAALTVDQFSLHDAGRSTEFALHGRAHLAIGGHMADSFCATADPTFWLHHSIINWLWDKWQRAEPTRRFVHCCENGTELFRNPKDKRVGSGTVMNFGVLDGAEVTLAGVADTMRGGESGYCY